MKTPAKTKMTNTVLPRLPEPSFAPLPAATLEAMIGNALAKPQEQRSGEVIAFRRPMIWGGMAALAASVMLAVVLTPSPSFTTASSADGTPDFSDMLVYESLAS